MRKAASVFLDCLFVLMILAAAAVYVPRFFGIAPIAVLSESMEPVIARGSLVYAFPEEEQAISPGELAAYWSGSAVVVCRVTGVDENGDFTVESAAEDFPELAPIQYSSIIGVVRVRVLYAGRALELLRTTEGKITAVAGAIALLAVMVLLHLGGKTRGRRKSVSGSSAGAPAAYLPERMTIPEIGVYSPDNRYMPGSAGASVFFETGLPR
jgi:signal peptidase